MKRKLFLSLFIVFFTTSFMSLVGCNNQKDYQLQERCGKRSQKFFQNEYGNGTISNGGGYSNSSYECHYNKKLNKCFILISTDGVVNYKNESYHSKSLSDVNENKKLGYFVRTNTSILCVFSGKIYESEKEWNSLVKPYMEE